MHDRISALKSITRHNLYETLISPAFYIMLSLNLLLSFILVSGFINSIGSSGFKPGEQPLYGLITRTLSGVFGDTLAAGIFSSGPFSFILILSFIPFFIYLAIGSLYKLGMEKSTGALELIIYGPVDATTCFLASLLRNIILTAAYLLILFSYYSILALINNLVIGPVFFYNAMLLFFTAAAMYSYAVLIAAAVDYTASAVILFLFIFIFFIFLQIGAYALISGYVKILAGVYSYILRWFSPVYYWNHGMETAGYGKIAFYLLDLLSLLILSLCLLFVCNLVLKIKGVRT